MENSLTVSDLRLKGAGGAASLQRLKHLSSSLSFIPVLQVFKHLVIFKGIAPRSHGCED